MVGKITAGKTNNIYTKTEVEDEYIDVVMSFLEKNVELPREEALLEKVKYIKILREYNEKIENGTFSKDDVPGLIRVLCKDRTSVTRKEIMKHIGKVKKQIADYFGYKQSEILIEYPGRAKSTKTFDSCKIVLGDAHIEDLEVGNELQFVLGDVYSEYPSDKRTLKHIKFIGGDLYADEARLDFGDLKVILGDFWGLSRDCEVRKAPDINHLPIVSGGIHVAGKLQDRYTEYYKAQSKLLLNADDIGKIGFGSIVDECDKVERIVKSLIEQSRSKESRG